MALKMPAGDEIEKFRQAQKSKVLKTRNVTQTVVINITRNALLEKNYIF